jgi:hypothetical protein
VGPSWASSRSTSTAISPKKLTLSLCAGDAPGQQVLIDPAARGAHRLDREPVVLGGRRDDGIGDHRQTPRLLGLLGQVP